MPIYREGITGILEGEVATTADLPTTARDGAMYLIKDIDKLKVWDQASLSWKDPAAGGVPGPHATEHESGGDQIKLQNIRSTGATPGMLVETTASGPTTLIPSAGLVRQTTAELHVYADGTSGDDANTGLTELAPKKTLQAVLDLVPFIVNHNVCVHLKGTFTQTYVPIFQRIVNKDVFLVVDGGSDVTVFDDNTGANYVVDASTTQFSLVANPSPSWALNYHNGYWIQILDAGGVPTGQIRSVQMTSAANTVIPSYKLDPVPTAGMQFRFVKPATIITGMSSPNSGWNFANLANNGDYAGVRNALIRVQRLSFTGASTLAINNNVGRVDLGGCMVFGTGLVIIRYSPGQNYISHTITDPSTFTLYPSAGGPRMGIRTEAGLVAFYSGSVSISGLCSNGAVTATGCYITFTSSHIRGKVTLQNNWSYPGSFTMSSGGSTFPTPSIRIANASGAGILTVDNRLSMDAGVDISGCSSHAIECDHSKLVFNAAITGSGNTGAGVYAHSGSVVHVKNGAPPTLTGTVGDISLDGTTEAAKWAHIDGGLVVADVEGALIKEVA